jgi:hypothetical protein
MDKLPQSLRYNASKMMMRENNFYIRTTGVDSGGENSIFRIKLPSRSLIDLSSLNLIFDAEFTGLEIASGTGGANWRNVKIPSVYKMLKYCRVYVNGQIASGGLCNHYDILYHSLLQCTASEDYLFSRLESGMQELYGSSDEVGDGKAAPAATTKNMHYVHTDLLGLFRSGSDNCILDSSLWGDVEIEFCFNTGAALQKTFGGTGNDNGATGNVSFKITNVHSRVNCITQISPLYNQVLEVKLSEKGQNIRLPYMNFITNVLNGNQSNRIQVNSGCIDSVLFAPLGEKYDTNNNPQSASSNHSSPRYTFNCGRDLNNAKTCSLSLSIGSEQYPRQPYTNCLDVASATTQSFWGENADSRSLLYQGITSGVASFSRSNFLSQNFIWNCPFSNAKEGYRTRTLAGIDTSNQSIDIILNQNNLIPENGFAFIAALTTSMLVYNTDTQSVQVIL